MNFEKYYDCFVNKRQLFEDKKNKQRSKKSRNTKREIRYWIITVINKTSSMEQEANKILEQFKNGNITKDKARRLLFVLSGVTYCKLDRLKEEL